MNLNDPSFAVKDFQKLMLAKDMASISLNRHKNREFYDYGQLMDKDVPIYHRLHNCSSIIGLEN